MCHVSVATHVPVCAQHRAPLSASVDEPGHGFCRECYVAGYHAHHAVKWWGWLHRDTFNGDELPPANGYPAIVEVRWS
jgi:hypothetical protein